jgi:HAE1 family hydrophobic/amphiphilic exporter-1
MTLTELAIKRPSLIVVIFTVLSVLGIFGYSQLKYELLPKMTVPVVVINTVYPGASPTEVENTVTKPIEDAVSGLDKISRINSTSMENLSLVTIEFTQAANVDVSIQDAQRKVNQILSTLPQDVKSPILTKIALDEIPVLRMGVTSSMPSRDFYQFLKDNVQPRIANVAGVAQVSLIGGDEREIRINLDAQKIQSYGLSVNRVLMSIKTANLDFPTGNLKGEETQYVVRVAGKFSSVEELRNLVVTRSKDGGEVRLSDVAEVQDGSSDIKTLGRLNGVSSVGLFVQKQTDANAVDVSRLVRAELIKMEKDYNSKDLKFNIAQDGSLFTIEAADAVKHDLALAVLLVAAVMFLFLHSYRNSLIVMVAIPASLVSTFFAMYIFGFSLNLMTLLALSLVIGILVDDSIVVLENIYHHMEKGEEKRKAALTGRNEIGFAALSITLVDVVVFLPLSVVSGLVGNIMREFSIVVVVSTLMSLFVSFTITPLLASRFSKIEHLNKNSLMGKFGLWFERLYESVKRNYIKILHWSLLHRWVIIVSAVVLFFSSFMLVGGGFIGFEFMPQSDRGEFTVTLELPPGSTIENTNFVTQQVERIIGEMPEIKTMFVNVGSSSEGLIGQSSNNASEISVALVPKEERARSTDDVGHDIKQKVQAIPGVKVRINPIGIFGTANQTPIQIVATGTELAQVSKGAEHIADLLRGIKGTADVRLSAEDGKPETRVDIDRQKMAAYGLTIADVGSALKVALSGDDESKFRQGNTEYAIRVMLDEFDRSNLDDVARMTFTNPKGEQIQLQQFASVYQTTGPTKLQRQDRNTAVTVFAQAVGRPSGTIVDEFRAALLNKPMPNGVSITYLGDEKNRQEGMGSLGLAFLAGLLFMYLIMVALYDSYVYPFVVLFSIPMAVIGAFLALALAMKSLSIFAMLGLIMLMGLVAKNAILLVDRANDMRRTHNVSIFEALMEAGESRLRPILMTTLAMVFGMMPIALASSAGAEWKTALAWVLIGGLTSSMLLTLVLVPVMYSLVESLRRRVSSLFSRKSKRTSISTEPGLNEG